MFHFFVLRLWCLLGDCRRWFEEDGAPACQEQCCSMYILISLFSKHSNFLLDTKVHLRVTVAYSFRSSKVFVSYINRQCNTHIYSFVLFEQQNGYHRYIRHDEIAAIEFSRVSEGAAGSTRNFDSYTLNLQIWSLFIFTFFFKNKKYVVIFNLRNGESLQVSNFSFRFYCYYFWTHSKFHSLAIYHEKNSSRSFSLSAQRI